MLKKVFKWQCCVWKASPQYVCNAIVDGRVRLENVYDFGAIGSIPAPHIILFISCKLLDGIISEVIFSIVDNYMSRLL
jgi:hypothetical protein